MRLLIAGGGTGGHLFPGVAIAQELLRRSPEHRVLFVGTGKELEVKVLEREGLPHRAVMAGGLAGKSIGEKVLSLLKLPICLFQSLAILRSFRPNLVLGTGGYVSGPVCLAAWLMRIPLVLQEQNVMPGLTNRLLGPLARGVLLASEKALGSFPPGRAHVVGNPLRAGFSHEVKRRTDYEGTPFRLLIFGGSQGARSINRAIMEALPYLERVKEGLSILHQTGERDLESVRAAYAKAGFSAEVVPFIEDMDYELARAHLALCRSGAMTVAELTSLGVPSLLIPLPSAAHGHQEANARFLEEKSAAQVLPERDLTGEVLAKRILSLMEDRKRLKGMSESALSLGRPDASRLCADLCLRLAGERPERPVERAS